MEKIMKKWLGIGFLLAPLAAIAVVSGEKVTNLDLKYIKNAPVYFDENSYRAAQPYDHLRIASVFATFFPNADANLMMLDNLAAKYAAQDLKIVALSPESNSAVTTFTMNLPLQNIAVAVDEQGKNVNLLLDGGMLSPRSFIIDADTQVIWDGATDDVADALTAIYENKNFNTSAQRRISAMQKDLEYAMAAGNPAETMTVSKKLLQLAPGNTMALRGFMTAAENAQTPAESFAFLNDLHTKNPQEAKLYFVLLDQCTRTPEVAALAGGLAEKFAAQFPERTAEINRICWGLLNNFAMQGAALNSAKVLTDKLAAVPQTPEILTTRALFASRTGDLNSALDLQQQAVKMEPNPINQAELQKFVEFYQAAVNLQAQK